MTFARKKAQQLIQNFIRQKPEYLEQIMKIVLNLLPVY